MPPNKKWLKVDEEIVFDAFLKFGRKPQRIQDEVGHRLKEWKTVNAISAKVGRMVRLNSRRNLTTGKRLRVVTDPHTIQIEPIPSSGGESGSISDENESYISDSAPGGENQQFVDKNSSNPNNWNPNCDNRSAPNEIPAPLVPSVPQNPAYQPMMAIQTVYYFMGQPGWLNGLGAGMAADIQSSYPVYTNPPPIPAMPPMPPTQPMSSMQSAQPIQPMQPIEHMPSMPLDGSCFTPESYNSGAMFPPESVAYSPWFSNGPPMSFPSLPMGGCGVGAGVSPLDGRWPNGVEGGLSQSVPGTSWATANTGEMWVGA